MVIKKNFTPADACVLMLIMSIEIIYGTRNMTKQGMNYNVTKKILMIKTTLYDKKY